MEELFTPPPRTFFKRSVSRPENWLAKTIVTKLKSFERSPLQPGITFWFMLVFLLGGSLYTASLAQAPVITPNIGMPVGNVSSTGVAYGNGVYVTVYSNGSIYTSTNGSTWAKVSSPGVPAVDFRLSFGAGTFVLVGTGGQIFTSTNGQNWTSRTSGTSNNLYYLQFLQSAFYAIGSNRTLLRSTDGSTWSAVSFGTGNPTDMFMNITFGNGVFAIGIRPSGAGVYVYRSTTGGDNSWTALNIDASESLNKVQYIKDRFYIFCSGTKVFTSADANTWTNSTASMTLTLPDASTQNIGSPNMAFNGIYDGSKIYLFGSSGYYGGYGSIFSSTDGVHFTLEPKTAYIVCQGSAFLNNKYFQYGNEGLVSSNDGIHYSYAGGNYNAMASNGSSYVGVGFVGSGSSAMGLIYSSPDFNTWTNRSPSGSKELYAVTYAGTKYVAAGNQTVLQSADGSSWSQMATPGDVITALAFDGTRLIAGAYDANTYAAKISYSTDGVTWSTANTDDNWYFKVKFVNGHYFALGYANTNYLGVIMHSADGITWSDITPNLPYTVSYFNDVVYDGSKYHFMGVDLNYEFFSVSTSTLADPNSFSNKGTITSPPSTLGGTWGEGAFAYSNGHFVGAAVDVNTYEAYVIYSSDGVSWTPVALNETTALLGIAAGTNTFRLLGTGDAKVTVSFAGTILPVSLTHFDASLVNGQSLLKWQTASEINSSQFAVQYSTNAISWQTIGTVKAAGQSSTVQHYQFVHTAPTQGSNYYRLIQADIDGKRQTSKVISVQIGAHSSMRLYPNPANDFVWLQLPGLQPAAVSIFNAGGQQVYRNTHSGNTQLSLKHLLRGTYQIVVKQNGKRYTQQLLLQ